MYHCKKAQLNLIIGSDHGNGDVPYASNSKISGKTLIYTNSSLRIRGIACQSWNLSMVSHYVTLLHSPQLQELRNVFWWVRIRVTGNKSESNYL